MRDRSLSPWTKRQMLTSGVPIPVTDRNRREVQRSPRRELLDDRPSTRRRSRSAVRREKSRSRSPWSRRKEASRDRRRSRSRERRRSVERNGENGGLKRKRDRSRERSPSDRYHRRHRSRSREHRNGDGRQDRERESDGKHGTSPSQQGFSHSRIRSRSRSRSRDRDRHQRHRKGHRGSRKTRQSSSSPPSPPHRRRRRSPSHSPQRSKRSLAPLPSQQDAFRGQDERPLIAVPPKQQPSFTPSGKLAAETNRVDGTDIVLKYNEPPDSRLPPSSAAWRLYEFKGKDIVSTTELHTRSCWLFGRERQVVDCPVEHPSCSKQHAVIQFRYAEKTDEWGAKKGSVRPYVIDLESANGTTVNGEKIEAARFVELRDKDLVQFGESRREYVLMLPPKEA